MMKTLKLQRNLFYSLVITVILISCQKDKDHADESGKQSTETKTKVPPTRDISMMRSALDDLYSHEKIAAYHTLSDSAKYTYWYFRITDYLEGDFRPGNQDQTDALLELRDSLSYRLYSDTAVRDAFKTNFLNDWIADNTVLWMYT